MLLRCVRFHLFLRQQKTQTYIQGVKVRQKQQIIPPAGKNFFYIVIWALANDNWRWRKSIGVAEIYGKTQG
jgi:hypothetical protein